MNYITREWNHFNDKSVTKSRMNGKMDDCCSPSILFYVKTSHLQRLKERQLERPIKLDKSLKDRYRGVYLDNKQSGENRVDVEVEVADDIALASEYILGCIPKKALDDFCNWVSGIFSSRNQGQNQRNKSNPP